MNAVVISDDCESEGSEAAAILRQPNPISFILGGKGKTRSLYANRSDEDDDESNDSGDSDLEVDLPPPSKEKKIKVKKRLKKIPAAAQRAAGCMADFIDDEEEGDEGSDRPSPGEKRKRAAIKKKRKNKSVFSRTSDSDDDDVVIVVDDLNEDVASSRSRRDAAALSRRNKPSRSATAAAAIDGRRRGHALVSDSDENEVQPELEETAEIQRARETLKQARGAVEDLDDDDIERDALALEEEAEARAKLEEVKQAAETSVVARAAANAALSSAGPRPGKGIIILLKVRVSGEGILPVRIKNDFKFDKVRINVARKKNIAPENCVLMRDGDILYGESSPRDYGLHDDAEVDLQTSPLATIPLKIRLNGRVIITEDKPIRVRINDPILKIRRAVAIVAGNSNLSAFKFEFEGDTIDEGDTCGTLDIDEMCMIDVSS
jgi:hypothetical protein